MSGILAGKLSKLKLVPYKDEEYQTSAGTAFSVLINPNSFKHNSKIEYAGNDQTTGRTAQAPKFALAGEEEVSFDIVMDGTRIAQSLLQIEPVSVETQISNLKKVVYTFNGDIHQPNYVQIVWGSFLFNLRLKSLNVEYTLFKPSGDPLRAKVQLAFSSYMSEKTALAKANMSSPDMTHQITVKAGDTLPLLCHQVYNSSKYYMQVAEKNGLSSFQDIKPGMQLYFPPLS